MTTTNNDLIEQPSTNLPPAFGGELPRSLVKLRPIISNAFESWLNRTESEATREAYRNDVKQFLSFHGIDPSQIEQMTRMVPDDVTSWRDHLLRCGGRPTKNGEPMPASNATVARKITALRSFFSFLQVGGYRGGNPAHPNFVKAPSVPDEGLTPAIHPKLLRQLLDQPDPELPVGIRDRAILAMFAYMALRVDELHHVNVGNIARDGDHTVVRIKGKGNETRKGVLPPVAATAVNAWISLAEIEQDRRGPLFRPVQSNRGQGRDGFKRDRYAVRSIQELIKKYCRQVGIDDSVSVHSLRVTAATEADKAGVPLISIQKWLGHKDPRTTLRYIRGHENLDESPAYMVRYS
ncbi:MAG: tyrosine-type recombinase/integrase [Planctomycetota bacterium]